MSKLEFGFGTVQPKKISKLESRFGTVPDQKNIEARFRVWNDAATGENYEMIIEGPKMSNGCGTAG